MDDLFVTQHFDWDPSASGKVKLVNKVLAGLGTGAQVASSFTGHMTTIEQRINLFHLLSQVLAYRVPGDIVEIGTHEGITAVLLALVNRQHEPPRTMHLYDLFADPPATAVAEHLKKLNLPAAITHPGYLNETLPTELPETISFVNIDLGPGRGGDLFEADLYDAIAAVYPRMAPGAIGVLQDYCDPESYHQPGYHFPGLIRNREHWNIYPQVKHACDRYFVDKPEKVYPLYSGGYSHGYFRKRL